MTRASVRRAPWTARFVALVASFLALGLTSGAPARAGGFHLLERGTRTLGRGGAMVAGAGDPSALVMNVAGLGYEEGSSGRGGREQFLFDLTFTFLEVRYERIDGGGRREPAVLGESEPIPIPTIAGTFDFGLDDLTFGVGLHAPNAVILTWPEAITVAGEERAAPQRYSLLSMQGSAILGVDLGIAYRPIPELSIGLGGTLVWGSFAARTTLSSCDGAICTFPEDPEYDSVAQLTLGSVVTGTGTAGVIWDPGPVRIGLSMTTPYVLSGAADIRVRPPSAAAFEGAFARSREGACASVSNAEIAAQREAGGRHPCETTLADFSLDFPWIVRLGVQLDAVEHLALEAAVVWEAWSTQREVTIRPREAWIADSLGFLDYQVGRLDVPRYMSDTISVRLGAEYTIDDLIQLRGGGYYENGAFSDAYLQALTIDSDKLVVAIGASVRAYDGLFVDALVGYAHLFPRNVRTSRVPQPNPIRPSPAEVVYVGNGDYTMTAPFFGVGLRWVEPAPSPSPPTGEPEGHGASEAIEATTSEAAPPDEPASDASGPALDPDRPWYEQGASASPSPSPRAHDEEPARGESAAPPPLEPPSAAPRRAPRPRAGSRRPRR